MTDGVFSAFFSGFSGSCVYETKFSAGTSCSIFCRWMEGCSFPEMEDCWTGFLLDRYPFIADTVKNSFWIRSFWSSFDCLARYNAAAGVSFSPLNASIPSSDRCFAVNIKFWTVDSLRFVDRAISFRSILPFNVSSLLIFGRSSFSLTTCIICSYPFKSFRADEFVRIRSSSATSSLHSITKHGR